LLLNLFEREARALLCERRLELGGVGIYDSKDRRIFFDLSQISTVLEREFYFRELSGCIIIDNKFRGDHRS